MLFNSIEFFVFLLVVLVVYWTIPHGGRKILLLIASIVFYLSWSFDFLLHFAAVMAINYPIFLKIYRTRRAGWLAFAVILNLINLFFFKYFYFFMETVGSLSGDAGMLAIARRETDWFPDIILPLAISFYTFQIIAMQVDAYRAELPEKPSFVNFVLFICFFPQLIAGPIVRHFELLPHLDSRKDPSAVDYQRGLALLASGVIKKVVIADFIAGASDAITFAPLQYQSGYVLIGCIFFAIRIYCDFSGYTDLARGAGLLLGFDLPVNFRGPFFSLSFQEHWRRWHITLSTWLKDYLYIALGGSRVSEPRTYFNLAATFFLGGVWHGAGWGFALWGAFHGCYLAAERFFYKMGIVKAPAAWGRRPAESGRDFALRTVYNVVKCTILFLMMCIVGVFFNAGVDPWRGVAMLQAIFISPGDAAYPLTGRHALVMLLYFFLHWLEYNDYFPASNWAERLRAYFPIWGPAGAIALLLYCSWKAGGDMPFVYFQF